MAQSASIDDGLRQTAEHLSRSLAAEVLSDEVVRGELTIRVQRDLIVKVIKFLKDDSKCQFTQLLDICGVDYPERDVLFDVVYN